MNRFLSAFLARRLLDRAGGHRAAVLDEFGAKTASDRWNREQLDRCVTERLARLLNHAREHVPRFRRDLGARPVISPAQARDALQEVPVMRRAEIQSDSAPFLSDVGEVFAQDATGGSTGTPMVFAVDRETQVAREASLMWSDSLAGWRPGERIAMLWGSDRDVAKSARSLRLALRNRVENRRWYNAFDMSEERMAHYHEQMSRFRPDLLVAYAGAAETYSRFLQRRGLSPDYPTRGLVSSAEILFPPVRALVEKVFCVKVFDRYGNRECGAIAAECPAHDGLHVNEADFVLEIDSPNPFRESGPILITYLRNFVMPFIRYDTGDLGVFHSGETCTCGRCTLRLAPVMGRQSDTIRTATGNVVHGEFFTHVLYGAPGIRRFQFVQERENLYRLRLVADSDLTRGLEQEWRSKIMEVVGDGAELNFEYVDDIPLLPSGKRKFTVSLVDE